MKRSVLLSSFLVAAVLTPVLLQTNYCDLEKYQKLARLELYVPDINGQNVISDFDPDGILYKVELPLDPPDTAVLLVQAQDATATIEVTYDSLPISLGPNGVAPLTLAPDRSEIRVAVMADNKAWTYTVSIDRVDYCPCDDGNVCTYDICIPADQVCVYRAVPDGTLCEGIRGGCYGGVCNFVPVSVAIGPKEVVFDWTTDRCEDYDLPDVPAKVARAEDGELVLFANHAPTSRVMRGPDFDTLQQVCDPPALVSADLPTPDSYENLEYLWSIYREGPTWHALVLNEFHDPVATSCKPGDSSTANPCAYLSMTYAASVDGARSFAKPLPPAHVVAPHTEIWTPPAAPLGFYSIVGYTGTSNIVRGKDGYYYALLSRYPSSFTTETYTCLMRTDTLHDPASWRAWSGTAFDIRMESPYVTGEPTVPCAPLPRNTGMASLTYNTYLDLYMVVNNGGGPDGPAFCGMYLWTSPDLIHWGDAQLIAPARMFECDLNPQTPGLLDPLPIGLPSIIDHEDTTVNFERSGRTAYLYYMRNNDGGLDRDLVRVPLKFTLGGVLCEGVDCDDQNECTDDVCNGADGSCEHTPIDCADSNDCTIDTCSPTIGCEHTVAADGTPCGGGSGICQDGSCAGYTQDFESLDQASPTALSDDGWLVFGKVFEADGTTFVRGYGPFSAPNNPAAPAFSLIAAGEGGAEQGTQQMVIISDYNNIDDQMAGRRVEANTYRERTITADDVSKIVTFSFDARRGNINDSAEPACINTSNPPCDSTADAFIKTIDPNAGFVTTNLVEEDTTDLPTTWDRYSIELAIDPGLVGQLLQFGYSGTASNFEPAGVLYDNILVVTAAP